MSKGIMKDYEMCIMLFEKNNKYVTNTNNLPFSIIYSCIKKILYGFYFLTNQRQALLQSLLLIGRQKA